MNKIITLMVFLLVFSGMIAYSQDNGQNPVKKQANIERLKKSLSLTDDQVTKIQVIMNDSAGKVEAQRIELQRSNLDLKEELNKEKPDLNKVKSIIGKKYSSQTEIDYILIKRDLDIKAVLTPDQIAKWKTQFIEKKSNKPIIKNKEKKKQK
jgi:Spy/CpxP family protein refolding chaperone